MKPLREAVSLVFRDGEKVFVVQRALGKDSFPGFWSIPSTYLHEGESVQDAATRLVKRKLGLSAVTISDTPLGISDIVEHAEFRLRMHDYVVETYEPEITINSDEYTESRWLTPTELFHLLQFEHQGVMGECTRVFLQSEGLIEK